MATVLPPPSKRLKTAIASKAREQEDLETVPTNLGSVRIQFHDHATGNSTGPAVAVPVADATVKNLELLLNTLQGNDDESRIPYRFSLVPSVGEDAGNQNSRDITNNLYASVLKSGLKSTEDCVHLQYTPQAVFRVRAVSRCSASIAGHGEAILATQFSPSSSRMVSGSGDSTARIWDCETGTPVHTLKGHSSWVLAVCWSPDGSMIATGSMDNTVRLWNPTNGQCKSPLKGHTKWITSLAWEPFHLADPETPRIASASKDSTVRIWNAVLGRIENVLSGHKSSVTCVKWGGLGKIYTSSQDKTVKIWDASTATLLQSLTAHAHWVNHLALSSDFVLRTAYHDFSRLVPASNTAKIDQAKSRFEKATTTSGKVVERLVTASDDFTMYLWEPSHSSKPVARMLGHQKQVNHVTFSPDGLYIASAGFDNHVKLWNARDGQFIATLRGHVAPVYQTSFSPDSRLLVSGSKDTTLKVWDVRTGKLREDLPGHQDEVYAVDWSPDGERVGSGGKDKAIKIWRN